MTHGLVSSVGTDMTNGNAGSGTALRGKMIGYWVTTVIVALVLFSGGFFQVMHQTGAVEGITRLGYPVYVVTILGVWKILGGVALLAPRTPRLKEWAYAGAFFERESGRAVDMAIPLRRRGASVRYFDLAEPDFGRIAAERLFHPSAR